MIFSRKTQAQKAQAMSPLEIAIERNDLAVVRRLLAKRVDLETRDRAGRTVLCYAVVDKKMLIAQALVAAGANVNVRDVRCWTPLHFASQNYDLEMVQLLVEAGAEIDPQDTFGNTPLGNAVFNSQGKGDVIRYLLSRGANKDQQNNHGVSPYSLAQLVANYNLHQFFEEEETTG